MKGKIRNIMIIGAMKAGTSSLFHYLSQHPQICAAVTKEPNYFSSDIRYDKHRSKGYMELFDLEGDHLFTLEGSTSYSKYPAEAGVPERIYKYGLRPKFIYIMRNPFDRIESHFNFMKHDLSWTSKITDPHLVATSNYYLQIKQYLSFFTSETIYLVDFDELSKRPKKVLDDICQFLGVMPFEISQNFEVLHKTPLLNRRKVKIKSFVEKNLEWIPQSVRSVGSQFLSLFLKGEKTLLTEEQRKFVYNALQSDMMKLEKEFGIDVGKWGFISNLHQTDQV